MKKKKMFLILLFGGLLLGLTGCGNDNEVTSIPDNIQGIYLGSLYTTKTGSSQYSAYYIFKVENDVVKQKICFIGGSKKATDCNFEDGKTGLYETITYDVKDIKIYTDDGIEFNMYDNDGKYADCNTNFGVIYCSLKNGETEKLKKQD